MSEIDESAVATDLARQRGWTDEYARGVVAQVVAGTVGDYHEGLEEGIKIGRAEAIADAVLASARPAGNRLMDFPERQTIIVRRIRQLGLSTHPIEPEST